jgi:ketosteroid isomerase-like protein
MLKSYHFIQQERNGIEPWREVAMEQEQAMAISRRSVCAHIGTGLAALSGAPVRPTVAKAAGPAPGHRAELVARSAASNAALMRGDIDAYRALIRFTDDFVLMSPFGGTPTHASYYTQERMAAMGRFFRNGVFDQELVQSYESEDMVVLALIERQNVEVGGLPPQDWALRVTLVYRREGEEWRLAHRHADPLVEAVSLQQAAALARGERPQ